MAVTEVTTRTFQEAVDLGDQLTDRYEGLLPARELTDSLSSSNHGLSRRPHVEVSPAATQAGAVVAQRKPQKVQALARLVQLDDTRLLAPDGQAKSPFQQSFDPVDQPPRLLSDIHVPQLGAYPGLPGPRSVLNH